jgi:hypothetical protein
MENYTPTAEDNNWDVDKFMDKLLKEDFRYLT